MTNPWPTPGRIRDQAAKSPGAGIRRAAGALPPPPFPPFAAPILQRFDFTDQSTVWADTAGTIPITDGTLIKRIDNLGTSGAPMIQGSTLAPTYRTNIVNGLGVADFAAGPGTRRLRASADPTAYDFPTNGITIAAIVRRTGSAPAGQQALISWAGNYRIDYNSPADAAPDDFLVTGFPVFVTLIAAPLLNNWYLLYQSGGGSGDNSNDAAYASPGPEDTSAIGDPNINLPGPHDVEITAFSGDYEEAESFILGGPMTVAERLALQAYADAKYGSLPHA